MLLRRLIPFLVAVSLGASACGSSAGPRRATIDSPAASPTSGSADTETAPVHPAFAAHFTDPIYSDEADELGPFGNDEGWDMLYSVAESGIDETTTVEDLLAQQGFEGALSMLGEPASVRATGPGGPKIPAPAGSIDAAMIVVGAGFTLLRLDGHIDDAGKRLTLRALELLGREFGEPTYQRQRADLAASTNPT